MNSQSLYNIRSVIPSDIPFIYSSWLKSFKHASLLGKSLRTGVFFENYREILDHIISQSHILIACLPDDPEVILGYLVYEQRDGLILHYSFVKESFRKLGIARSLFMSIENRSANVFYTHITLNTQSFIQSFDGFTYNPLLLYKKGLV